MGKRKADDELTRFVWKRNPQYDILLLNEVEAFNPYASSNQCPIWQMISESLLEGPLQMKVTRRSCRERVVDLLKAHRKGELASIRSSGTSAPQLTQLENLLISVAKLEETKPDNQLKSLYSTNDKTEAEAVRSNALKDIDISSDESQSSDTSPKKQDGKDDFEFGPKTLQSQPSNPKDKLVKYLESKSEKELLLRKEELRLREMEVENKAKELEILRVKAESDAAERRTFMELMVTLATPKPPQ